MNYKMDYKILIKEINKYELNEKFKSTYLKLFDTSLVKFHIINEKSIKEFENTINIATHINDKERKEFISMKNLYSKYENDFNYIINNNFDYCYLVLYTNGMFITKMLKINELVSISSKISTFYVTIKKNKRIINNKIINENVMIDDINCFDINYFVIDYDDNVLNINMFNNKYLPYK